MTGPTGKQKAGDSTGHPDVVGGFFVPQTSQSAVSRVSQPAGRPSNGRPPALPTTSGGTARLTRPVFLLLFHVVSCCLRPFSQIHFVVSCYFRCFHRFHPLRPESSLGRAVLGRPNIAFAPPSDAKVGFGWTQQKLPGHTLTYLDSPSPGRAVLPRRPYIFPSSVRSGIFRPPLFSWIYRNLPQKKPPDVGLAWIPPTADLGLPAVLSAATSGFGLFCPEPKARSLPPLRPGFRFHALPISAFRRNMSKNTAGRPSGLRPLLPPPGARAPSIC